jgi:hypothetical protein
MITYDALNRPDDISTSDSSFPTRSTSRNFGSFCFIRLVEGVPFGLGVHYPTSHFIFMRRFDSTSGQIVWQTISFGAVRACVTNVSRLKDSHLIRMNHQGLVPRRRGERNSGALSSEPFDMFGLNFQGVKRTSVEIGRTGDRMRE